MQSGQNNFERLFEKMNVQSNEAAQKTINEDFPLALPKGTILAGQYTIDDVLGQGGFGITYVATDYKTGQKVAVKEFFPDSLAYREMTTVISYPGERAENYEYGKENFLQEAKTLAEFIGCENIVRIYSYFEENGTAYFVMEYIEGVSFDNYLKDMGGKISCDEAKNILVPIMEALAIVHSKGIVHRDVTPDNIYITSEGTVKLLDFGAARYSLGDKSKSLDVILKHGFAPKEQYTRRGKQGPFTDIYSLGATFYFAVTGRRPPDSIDRIEEDELIPPSSLGVKITSYQEEAILHALEVSPQSRYQSMLDFRNVLLNETASAPYSAAVNQQFFTAPPTPAAMPVQQVPYTAQQPYSMPPQQPYPMNSQPYPAPAQQTENVSKQLGDAAKQFGSAAVQLGGGVAKQLGNTAKQLGGSAAKHMSNAAKKLSETAAKANNKMKSAAAHNESGAVQNSGAVYQSAPEVQHAEPLQSNPEFTNPAPNADAPVFRASTEEIETETENMRLARIARKKKLTAILAGAVGCLLIVVVMIKFIIPKDVTDMAYSADIFTVNDVYTYTDGSYTGKWRNNKPCGYGTLTFNNGEVYEGEWKDGKANGQGTLTWGDGRIYVGEWKNNRKDGEGKWTFSNGDVYEGEFKDGKISGQGVYKWTDGAIYDGEWKDGLKNGQGKYTQANGNVYKGGWKDDKMDGQGKCTFADGEIYEGEVKGNKYDGQGKYTYANGDVYEGEWKDNLRNGQGKYTYADGRVVTGIWKDDKLIEETTVATNTSKESTETTATTSDVIMVTDQPYNNGKYTGEWKNDKPNGQGKMTYSNGDVYEGEWKDGNGTGYGVYKWASGAFYEGEWKDGNRTGYGKFTFTNGDVYEGEFKDDNFNGQGKYKYINGDSFEGIYKDGKANGQCKYIFADGSIVVGIWKDGERIEKDDIASAIATANAKAINCHTACTATITQMYVDGKNVPSGAFEGSGTDFTIGGVKFDEILWWLGDNFTGYTYGYVKENWGIEYIMWSDKPIPDDYKHELTKEEQEELAKNGTVIGCYPEAI